MFVATSFPDRLGGMWWVALERVVAATERIVIEIGGEERFFYCERTAKKYEVYAQLYCGCARSATRRRCGAPSAIFCRRYGVDPDLPCREFCMTWPEIAEMAKSRSRRSARTRLIT